MKQTKELTIEALTAVIDHESKESGIETGINKELLLLVKEHFMQSTPASQNVATGTIGYLLGKGVTELEDCDVIPLFDEMIETIKE